MTVPDLSLIHIYGRQSLLLFKDVYCDYVLVAKNVYNLLKRLHPVRFHLAVSRRFDEMCIRDRRSYRNKIRNVQVHFAVME